MKIKLFAITLIVFGFVAIRSEEKSITLTPIQLTIIGAKKIYTPDEVVSLKVYNNSKKTIYCWKDIENGTKGEWTHDAEDTDSKEVGRLIIDSIKPKKTKYYKWPDRNTSANDLPALHPRMRLRFRIFYNTKKIKNFDDLNNSAILYSEAFEFRGGHSRFEKNKGRPSNW